MFDLRHLVIAAAAGSFSLLGFAQTAANHAAHHPAVTASAPAGGMDGKGCMGGMSGMGGMGGKGGMQGKGAMGGDMAAHHAMMEKRMDAMQAMMQTMMDRMGPAPAKQ